MTPQTAITTTAPETVTAAILPAKTVRVLRAEGKALKAALFSAYAAKEEATLAAKAAAPAEPAEDCDEAAIDAWALAVEVANDSVGLYETWHAVRAAEDALIAWAQTCMKAHFPTKYAAVAIVFEKGVRNPTIRPKLIDLTLRFQL